MDVALGTVGVLAGAALIVGSAELFAEHLGAAAARLGVTTFALALLLAGAEPEELATTVTGSLRHVPAVAFGDVIGANIAVCLVALGVGALVAPLPFGAKVRPYALLGLPIAALSVAIAWDGHVGRSGGIVLVGAYVAYVASIWVRERRPPTLGETGEVEVDAADRGAHSARDVTFVLGGLVGMIGGAVLLVEGLRGITDVQATQTDLSLTLIGFATAFELVVLAWSSARRGITEAAVAAVVGSFAYNATMSLGVAALARPLRVADAGSLHVPLLLMFAAFALVLLLALPPGRLTRGRGALLVATYPLFIGYVALR
jgi:cation:H+ antiporter